MNRTVKITIAAVSLGTVIGILILRLPSDPLHNGRPLSAWVEDLSNVQGEKTVLATGAIRAIGSNAIPYLLRELQARDSPLKLVLVAHAQKQRLISVRFVPAAVRWRRAILAVRKLEGDAEALVPKLIQCLASESSDVRADALGALIAISKRSDLCVPAFIASLSAPDPMTRVLAALALGMRGEEAKGAIPALLNALTDENRTVRDKVATALIRIDPATAANAGL